MIFHYSQKDYKYNHISRNDNYSYKKYSFFKQKRIMIFFQQGCFPKKAVKKIILTFLRTTL